MSITPKQAPGISNQYIENHKNCTNPKFSECHIVTGIFGIRNNQPSFSHSKLKYSGQFQLQLEFPRTELSMKPLSVNSEYLFYIIDAFKPYKLLVDTGANLSILEPKTNERFEDRHPENVVSP